MPSKSIPLQAQLDAWREQGADRIDPLRFNLLLGLAQRTTQHDGQVAQLLQQRLEQLTDDYARRVTARHRADGETQANAAVASPLRALLEHIGSAAPATPVTTGVEPASRPESDASEEAPAAPALESLAALDEFQQLWGRIRIDSLLRQSLESISEDAGPLHSSVLLHRAMSLMRDVSPEYLQHFLAYADVLTWMEQLGGNSANSGSEASRAAATKKSARGAGTRRKKQPGTPSGA